MLIISIYKTKVYKGTQSKLRGHENRKGEILLRKFFLYWAYMKHIFDQDYLVLYKNDDCYIVLDDILMVLRGNANEKKSFI